MTAFWPPLLLSLQIAVTATCLAAVVTLPLAYALRRRQVPGRSVLEAAILLPLALPPTVTGYLILMMLGAGGWPGRLLHEWFDYSIMFRFEGALLAAAVTAAPLIYLPSRAAFATVPREMEEAAVVAGASRLQTMRLVNLPLAARGISTGLLLGFARAIGEFGATTMVFGWREDHLTLPIAIYASYERGRMADAAVAVVLLSALSLVVVAVANRFWSDAT